MVFLPNPAQSFNKRPRFALGLILLYPVFIGIPAFGKAQFARIERPV